MAKVGIIANPHSKLNRQKPSLIGELQRCAESRAIFRPSQDLDHLAEIAEEFSQIKPDIIGICGGDGTISQCLSALYHSYKNHPLPKIALLRGGTMNLVAQNLGQWGSPLPRLKRLLDNKDKDLYQKPLLTLKVGEKIGFAFASGTSALFLQEFYKRKKGVASCLSLIGQLASSYFVAPPFFNRIVMSQETKIKTESGFCLDMPSLTILCSTVDSLPLSLPLFYGASGDLERFYAISVAYSPTQIALRGIYDFLLFPKNNTKNKIRFTAKTLDITTDISSIYTLDGDIYQPEQASVRIEKGPPVSFLVF